MREIQGLDYKVGPALICEAWTIEHVNRTSDQEMLAPVRIGAMLRMLERQGQLGDATLTFQDRTLAMQTWTDERLKRKGMWIPGSDHIRDAARHTLTGLRRANESLEFAMSLWPYREVHRCPDYRTR